MNLINNPEKLKDYIQQFNLHQIFETDMQAHMSLCKYDKGEDILVSGEPMIYFYFIVEGKAKIFNTLENGKSVLLRFTRPLSELGSVEVLEPVRIVHSNVQSLYGTTVIRIPFQAIDEHTKDDTSFYKFIVRRLSHKLSTISNTHALNTTYPFKNRFASYLLSLTRIDDVERIDEIDIDQLTDLATFLGTSYRHLNRVVKEMVEDGIIKKTKNSFIILDYKQLEELSGGFYE